MNPHQQMRPEFDRGCIDMGGSQNYCRCSEMYDFLTGMTGFQHIFRSFILRTLQIASA